MCRRVPGGTTCVSLKGVTITKSKTARGAGGLFLCLSFVRVYLSFVKIDEYEARGLGAAGRAALALRAVGPLRTST